MKSSLVSKLLNKAKKFIHSLSSLFIILSFLIILNISQYSIFLLSIFLFSFIISSNFSKISFLTTFSYSKKFKNLENIHKSSLNFSLKCSFSILQSEKCFNVAFKQNKNFCASV